MFHLDNSSGVDTMPTVANKQSDTTKWFTEGDNVNPPSYPGQDWFNIMQAECLNILKVANITPKKTQLNQLSTAIQQIVNNAKASSATTTAAGIVQLSSAVNSEAENHAATPKAVKTAYDLANTAKTAAETDASTTVKGRIQLNSAINSTVENQAATPKAVKTAYDLANGRLPLTGGTVTGNTNFSGKLQQAGNDVLTTASIKSLFENKLTDSGYQKLPNGLIIQWQNNFAPTTGNISLPISFPNKGLALVVGNTDRQGAGVDNAYGYIVNNSTVFIALKGQNNTTNQQYKVSYIVIGY